LRLQYPVDVRSLAEIKCDGAGTFDCYTQGREMKVPIPLSCR